MFDAVQVYQANKRQATAKTKTRAEVRGGGKKPWRQKGTGRARAGSSRSPLWVGGGTVFGPDGRQNYKLDMNKKSHALALKSALSIKASEKNIVLVDSLTTEKTKEFIATLKALNVTGKALVVLAEENEAVMNSARNVPGITVVLPNNVSVYDLLNAEKLVCTVDAVKKLEGGLK
jgi:large subunit ribosomal protein L4